MSEQTEAPAMSRDEILQTHLLAIRAEIRALPWRIAWAFVGVGVILSVIGGVLWYAVL